MKLFSLMQKVYLLPISAQFCFFFSLLLLKHDQLEDPCCLGIEDYWLRI